MEHVELETLDREHTASNKKDPQLNHEKKPTKKSIKVLKLIGTKNTSVCFYYSIYRWLQRIVWFNRNLHRRLYCNRLINVFKIRYRYKTYPSSLCYFWTICINRIICICSSHKPVAWTVDKLYYRMCHYGIVRSKSRVPFFLCHFYSVIFSRKSTPVYDIDFGMRMASLSCRRRISWNCLLYCS